MSRATILPDGVATPLLDALLRTDLATFIGKVHGVVSPGTPFEPNWHIEAIAHALEQVEAGTIRRLLVTLPPRTMKSTAVTIGFTASLLGRQPTIRIISASYAEALSAKFASDTRRVMQSAWYRRIFPGTVLQRVSEQELTITAGGSRLATSVGGTLTGRGADLIVIDDPHKAEEASSRAALARVRDWYDGTLLSRLDDRSRGRIVVVMQRLHVDDLAGHLLAQGGWHHLSLPAVAEVEEHVPIGMGRCHLRRTGDVLQSGRDTIEGFELLKRQMGSALFSAQFQQAPVPAGGHLIDWEWLARFDLPFRGRKGDLIIQSWDTANKGGKLSDYSVGMTFAVRGNALFLLDVVRERLNYPDLKRTIGEGYRRHAATLCLVEDAGVGSALVADLRCEGIASKGVRPEGDKVCRMSRETAQLEAGLLAVPTRAPWLAELRAELLAFPRGRNDDQVDALSQALAWTRTRRSHGIRLGVLRGAY